MEWSVRVRAKRGLEIEEESEEKFEAVGTKRFKKTLQKIGSSCKNQEA